MARTKSYFRLEKFALLICGISFREHDSSVYKISSKILLFTVCAYPFIAAMDLFKHDFETVADSIIYEFSLFIAVAKAITVLFNREKIAKVLNKLDADLRSSSLPSGIGDEELMKECVFITTAQTIMYGIATVFSYSFALAYTLSKRIRSNDYHDWQFPYGTFTVLNVTHSPTYEISLAYQCWSVFFAAIIFTTVDLTMAAILVHVCYNLKILQNALRRMVDNTLMKKEDTNTSSMSIVMEKDNHNHVESVNEEWKNLNARLIAVVDYHLGIINITKEVDDSLSGLLLLVFLGTLGILAFMVYKASLIPSTDVRMLKSFGEFSIIFLQVAMLCFWSEQMMSEGLQVGTAAYECSFVGTDLRFQKSLILIIRRSQTPITLNAGFVEVSLATFVWILRSTYSSYMVLRKQNLDD